MAVCAAGFAFSIYAFYPGFMSEDSFHQLAQAREWAFSDRAPPIMAVLWGLLDRMYPGPLPMLLLHGLIFWGACAGLSWLLAARYAWLALLPPLIGFTPSVFFFLGLIWKDVGMGIAFYAASALLYVAARTGKKLPLAASLPFLFYGTAVRHNAPAAALPLAIWAGHIFAAQRAKGAGLKMVGWGFGMALLVLLVAASLGLTRLLVHPTNERHSWQLTLTWDLLYMAEHGGGGELADGLMARPDEIRSLGIDEDMVWDAKYATGIPQTFEVMGWLPKHPISATVNPEKLAALKTRWLSAVLRHPRLYLEWRWLNFRTVNGFLTEHTCYPYYWGLTTSNLLADPTNPRLGPISDELHLALLRFLVGIRDSLWYRPWIWLLVAMAVLTFTLRSGAAGGAERSAALALSASAVLYDAAYFPIIQAACDFRYNWWTVLSAMTALVFLLLARVRPSLR